MTLPRLRQAWAQAQHRDAAYLMLNTVATAAAGLVFWLVATRVLQLPAREVGVGSAVIALGTLVAVLAKGGLDTALLRYLPSTGREGNLFGFALGLGGAFLLAVWGVLALWGTSAGAWPELGRTEWLLVALIGMLLLYAWLQDAVLLSGGRAGQAAARNLGGAVVRIVAAVALALVLPLVIPLAWAIGVLCAVVVGNRIQRRIEHAGGTPVSRRTFVASAVRNMAGTAAEFLPGLLLTPILLAVQGPEAAAHFAMAWTLASMLLLACSAIARSALRQLVAREPDPATLRRALRQQAWIVLPGAAGLALLAPWLLGVFGPGYADAAPALVVLAASALLAAPASLALSVLRAREHTAPMVLLPTLTLAMLLVLAPTLAGSSGTTGAAFAWLLANVPFAAYATWRLHQETREARPQEVMPDAAPVGRGADAE
ncbi:MAG: hypothetical protein QOD77_731 [Thermoplasmata archaeon]|jgi:O-antigen/teichoic acid export membrane protein|nr:hypothetical protein [Thermoplasmata archaeon]